MASANIDLLKKLRTETSASISDCRSALEQTENDYDKAIAWLKKRGLEKAEKKSDRETSQGLVEAYIHNGGKVGALIVLQCETDFVARTEEFKNLAKEIGMQVSAMDPETVEELLKQEYIRDSSQTIDALIKSVIGKLGENITLRDFKRFAI
ncbi:MAG: translation elongation factor Ts [Candidatus Levybacteria bacterium]|nr:translation elongation factor Ts [Candidatus Levybacteria bacterium]